MRVSTFSKDLEATGTNGKVSAKIVVAMNSGSKIVTGTHPSTHDDFARTVPTHKIESIVDGKVWKKIEGLDSEMLVLNESEKLIKETNLHITDLANRAPVKTFSEKMSELFS